MRGPSFRWLEAAGPKTLSCPTLDCVRRPNYAPDGRICINIRLSIRVRIAEIRDGG